jgi:hypothetical protein
MAEKTTSEKKTRTRIPEETRQHYRNARQEMRQSIETKLPEGFIEHHKNAHKEMLLAWRSMLDAAIQRMEEKK